MDGDAELTKSRDSLHFRKSGSKIYETRTPDGEPAYSHGGGDKNNSEAKRRDVDDQTTLFNWEAEGTRQSDTKDVKGKGKAMTYLDSSGNDGPHKQENGHSAASSEASDEDDELLPSFGGQDDFDRPVSSFNSKNARMSNSSNSRASLGMHQNGFISRDDMLDNNHSDRLASDAVVDYEKPDKEGASSKTKPKRRRKKVDRYNPGRFAREMAFVVSFASAVLFIRSRTRVLSDKFAEHLSNTQTVPSILLSMLGSVLAGEVLAEMKVWSCFIPDFPGEILKLTCSHSQRWPVFLRVEELFILVPILLNLKGNLEMNLAARFSTSVSFASTFY